jgi:hypothetical protein
MRARLVVLGAVAGCTGAPMATRAPVVTRSEPACVGRAIPLARHSGILEDVDPLDEHHLALAEAQEDGGESDFLTVAVGCGKAPCNPTVLRMSSDGEVLGEAPLPGAIGPGRVEADWIATDRARRELWTSYAVGGAHRLALFALPALTLRWSAPYGCDASLRRDACDGVEKLVLRGCGEARTFVRGPDGVFRD